MTENRESNAMIPKEIPGTSEQLKQLYDSEYWNQVKEQFIKVSEALTKALTPIIKTVVESVKVYYRKLSEIYCVDPEIQKCYGIYKRTKKRKNKKKTNVKDKKNNK